MSSVSAEHRDKLGRLLKVGDCVAYPERNTLIIGTIKKFTPEMTVVLALGIEPNWYGIAGGAHKYPYNLVLLDGPEVTLYLLKQAS